MSILQVLRLQKCGRNEGSMKTQTPKMPRKLKKWYKDNLLRYLFARSSMSWAEYNKMDKLYHNKGGI